MMWHTTFPEEWRFVAVHVLSWNQAEVWHGVLLHPLEGAMFCYLLDDFIAKITAQEIWQSPESSRKVLREDKRWWFNECEGGSVYLRIYAWAKPFRNIHPSSLLVLHLSSEIHSTQKNLAWKLCYYSLSTNNGSAHLEVSSQICHWARLWVPLSVKTWIIPLLSVLPEASPHRWCTWFGPPDLCVSSSSRDLSIFQTTLKKKPTWSTVNAHWAIDSLLQHFDIKKHAHGFNRWPLPSRKVVMNLSNVPGSCRNAAIWWK